MKASIGNVRSIEVAYEHTKEYIVYDSFITVMIAIVLFLVFMKLFDEYQRNLTSNNGSFDFGSYWGQIRVVIFVCFISTSSGAIFNLVESIFGELQTHLINDFGGDTSDKSFQVMRDLVRNQVLAVQEKEAQGLTLDFDFIGILWKSITAIVMAIGVFIFKYTYTFFILGRYMWLLLLELIAPVAIILVIHENTRSYFYTWLKNMLICYLLIPMFLLADKFSNEVASFFMANSANAGQVSVLIVVCVGVWVKIKMFSIVKAKSSQLL
jgi:hypothetical protein